MRNPNFFPWYSERTYKVLSGTTEYTFIRYFPKEVGESREHARLMRHDPGYGGAITLQIRKAGSACHCAMKLFGDNDTSVQSQPRKSRDHAMRAAAE